MLIIPLQSDPSQSLTVVLANQTCQISVYQEAPGQYVDRYVNNGLIIGGVLAQDRNRIVRSLYLGFVGDLMFIDNQGLQNPDFTGLGARFSLAYLEQSDLPDGEG